MVRISSMFFMLSLLICYVPKIFKVKNKIIINTHIVTGLISVGAMLIALFASIGSKDLVKYLGFSAIMIGILVSGYLSQKKIKRNRKIHIGFTLGFFVYLFISVKFF